MKAIYYRIGSRIKAIREGLGLTQEELAQKVGIGRTTLTHIENGKHRGTLDTFYRIAQELNVSVYVLLPEKYDAADQLDVRKLFEEFLKEKFGIN